MLKKKGAGIPPLNPAEPRPNNPANRTPPFKVAAYPFLTASDGGMKKTVCRMLMPRRLGKILVTEKVKLFPRGGSPKPPELCVA